MSWFDDAVAQLSDDSNTVCEAGHTEHQRRSVTIQNGTSMSSMLAFNSHHYQNTNGYCPGDDDVSRTLALYGVWEPKGTEVFRAALFANEGEVIDFGTHIGWYTMLALMNGRQVLAVEAVREHEELTLFNAKTKGLDPYLHQAHCWVDAKTKPLKWRSDTPLIAVAKIDIEGNEQHAVHVLRKLIEYGAVRSIMLEVSPCFNSSYPDVVRWLMSDMGYQAAVIDPWLPFTLDEIDATVDLVAQSDMIFALEPWWS